MCLILKFKVIFVVLVSIGQIFGENDMESSTTPFTETSTVLSSSTSEPEVTNFITTTSMPSDKSTDPLATTSSTTSVESATNTIAAKIEDFTTLKDASVFETTEHTLTKEDTSESFDFLKQSSTPIETTTYFSTPLSLISSTIFQSSPAELSTSTVTVHDTSLITTIIPAANVETTTSTTITTEPFSILSKESESTQTMDTTSHSIRSYAKTLTGFDSTDMLSNGTHQVYIDHDDVEDENIVQVQFNTKDFKIYAWTHGLDVVFLTKMTDKLNSKLNKTLNTENVLLVRPSLLVDESVTCFQFVINSSQGIIPGSSVYQALHDSREDLKPTNKLKIVKIIQGTRPDYYQVESLTMFFLLTLICSLLIGFIILLVIYLRNRNKFINFQLNHHHHHQHQLDSNSSPKSLHTFTGIDFNSGAVILKEGSYFNDNQRQHDGWVKPYNDPVSNTISCSPSSVPVIDTHM